jgi:hypothetical protein
MSSTKLMYDDCAHRQKTVDSTSLVNYHFFKGKFENCTSCNVQRLELNEPTREGTIPLVDIESELDGRTRPHTKCDQFKFHPKCDRPGFCINKDDPRVHVNNEPSVCFNPKLAWNNIKKPNDVGYRLPNPNACDAKYLKKSK